MTPQRVFDILTAFVGEVEWDGSLMTFMHGGVQLTAIFHENTDRMRIVAPICKTEDATPGLLLQAMEANFHSALDARYATSRGVVWSAFIHPLSDLSEDLLRSATDQVATAAQTFGNDFQSGALFFGGDE